MKQYLRNRINQSASYFEIFLSILILLAVILVTVELVQSLFTTIRAFWFGEFLFDIHTFLGMIFELIIAVEFVKMLSKHTPESTIEVLLFVIARKIVIDEPKYDEILLGVAAIAALFIIKKYLTRPNQMDTCILAGDTSLKETNRILGTRFSEADGGSTLRDILMRALEQTGQMPYVGQEINLQDHVLRVYQLKNQQIDAVEALPQSISRLIGRFLRKLR